MDSTLIELVAIINLGMVAFFATIIFGILAEEYQPPTWVVDPVEVPEPRGLAPEVMAKAKEEAEEEEKRKVREQWAAHYALKEQVRKMDYWLQVEIERSLDLLEATASKHEYDYYQDKDKEASRQAVS